MVRISGIDLSNSKKIDYALTGIYGIGLTRARSIVVAASIDREKRLGDLNDEELIALREVIETNYKVEDDLRRSIKQNVVRLSQINCVRGRRHRQKLPLRGQRTRTNSRTSRTSRVI